MIWDKSKTELENIFEAINEQTEAIKENNSLLKEQRSFWMKVVNDEFLKELVENNEKLSSDPSMNHG